MSAVLPSRLATGDTVADTTGRLALVLLVDRSGRRVIVQWDGGPREAVETADLLTAPGECEHVEHHGSRWHDPEPDETCDEPTAPGETYCPEHGGAGWL